MFNTTKTPFDLAAWQAGAKVGLQGFKELPQDVTVILSAKAIVYQFEGRVVICDLEDGKHRAATGHGNSPYDLVMIQTQPVDTFVAYRKPLNPHTAEPAQPELMAFGATGEIAESRFEAQFGTEPQGTVRVWIVPFTEKPVIYAH